MNNNHHHYHRHRRRHCHHYYYLFYNVQQDTWYSKREQSPLGTHENKIPPFKSSP